MQDPVTCRNLSKFRLRVLQLSDGLGNPDGFQWELVATLAVSWIICYGCIWKGNISDQKFEPVNQTQNQFNQLGVKSTGKSVYVTSTFPLVMLLILLVRGLTLPGASKGIEFYIKPNLTALGEPRVWIDAGTQIFFSYAICLGSLTSLGNHSKFLILWTSAILWQEMVRYIERMILEFNYLPTGIHPSRCLSKLIFYRS